MLPIYASVSAPAVRIGPGEASPWTTDRGHQMSVRREAGLVAVMYPYTVPEPCPLTSISLSPTGNDWSDGISKDVDSFYLVPI